MNEEEIENATLLQTEAENLYLLVCATFVRTKAARGLKCIACEFDEPSQHHHDCLVLAESVRIGSILPEIANNLQAKKLEIREIFARVAVVELFPDLSMAFKSLGDLERKYLSSEDGMKKVEELAVDVSDIFCGTILHDDYNIITRIVEIIP